MAGFATLSPQSQNKPHYLFKDNFKYHYSRHIRIPRSNMQGQLLWLVMTLHAAPSSHGLPCCEKDYKMIHVNTDGQNSIYCSDFTSILASKWCQTSDLLLLDPENLQEGLTFTENSEETEITIDGQEEQKYCTGSFSSNFSSKTDTTIANKTDKPVVLVCAADVDLEELNKHYPLYAACLIISTFFLLATLAIYLWLPELRDLQGKCVVCFIFSLMIGYVCLAYLQLPVTSPELDDTDCIVIAFLVYFWMLSAFFWLNINSFNMWRSAVLSHKNMSEQRLMYTYHAVGWGAPLCCLAVALITHHMPEEHTIRPNFGVNSCWFKGNTESWTFFYGPVLVLLILNMVYFVSTALYLWADYRMPNPVPRIKSLRTKFCLYLKLSLIMGITWIFEILSSIANEPWYVTDILNCFQGVIIFVVMIATRKRVWRLLGTKRLCGVTLGTCWERVQDEETINDEVADEQQL